jgi:hypothetical protein
MSTAALVVLAALLISACEDTTPSPEERQVIEMAVRGYLDAKAEAYSTLNLEPLEGIASPNEIAAVRKLLTQLAQTGDRIDSSLIGFEVEDMSVFRGINATVRLIEVWDVKRYDAFTGREKGRNPSSLQNSIIQMRLIDGRWVVVGWSLLKVATPVESPAAEPATESEAGV